MGLKSGILRDGLRNIGTGVEVVDTTISEITNFLEDDWGDNALTSRSSTSDGVFAHPGANEAGDVLIGRYRPEWTTAQGNVDVTGGVLEWSQSVDGRSEIRTSSKFTVGLWEVDFHYTTLGNSGDQVILGLMDEVPDVNTSGEPVSEGYQTNIADNGNYSLKELSSGTSTDVISASWGGGSGNTNSHTCKITRDEYGSFELFEDGSSKGTATNTDHTESTILLLFYHSSAGGSVVETDNLVVK